MPIQCHSEGLATLRNQQVARSSRVTSSRKKRLPNQGAFSFWSIGFCNLCKTRACGRFPASLLGDRNLRLPPQTPLPFPGNSVCEKPLTHTLTHKRKVPETIRNPRRAGETNSPGILVCGSMAAAGKQLLSFPAFCTPQ